MCLLICVFIDIVEVCIIDVDKIGEMIDVVVVVKDIGFVVMVNGIKYVIDFFFDCFFVGYEIVIEVIGSWFMIVVVVVEIEGII